MSARRPTRVAPVLAATALLALAVGVVSFSTATFTAQTSNPGNSFDSSPYFGFFASGLYVGNDADNRAITGVGFRPDVVIVKGSSGNQNAAMRTSTMSGDAAKPMTGGAGLTANVIQSLDANGFTIGTDARVNSSGVAYEWMAFRAQDGLLKVGTYGGNGTSQSISGLGFSPEYAAVFSAGANNAVQRYSGGTTSFQFDNDTGNATRVTSLDANGLTVGAQNTVNASGTNYHWIAFNDSAGLVDVNGYSGNNNDDRGITGVGFQPEYVIVRANDTATGRQGVHRPITLPGDATLRVDNSYGVANALQALQSDGFQIGTDTSVNASGVAYRYLAVRDTADSAGEPCANPGSQAVAPAADAYVNQASPTSNYGGSIDLFVRSQSGNANRRTLVRFNLPSIPAGCSLTGAALRLISLASATGRTIDVYRAGAAWTENAVTWNTAPAPTGGATSLTSATGVQTWDVTSQVQAMYSGTNDGFVIRDQTENSGASAEQRYQAREGSPDVLDPELRVIWR